MKNLFIDFDGVILDTIPVLYSEAKKQGYSCDDNEFYKNFNFETILKDEYILNDSINCIDKIIKSNKFEVNILTHCHSLKEASNKVKYIRKYFKDITVIICPKDISKTKMVHTNDAILVDDFKSNLKEWEEEGGISIKFSNDLNDNNYKTINRLDALIEEF